MACCAKRLMLIACGMTLICLGGYAADEAPLSAPNISQQYPGLAVGSLLLAKTGPLPEGILLRAGEIEIKATDLEAELTKVPVENQSDIKNNAFYMLEQVITKKLLLLEAKAWAASSAEAKAASKNVAERELVQAFFADLFKDVTVTDEQVSKFYEENKDICGTEGLDKVGAQIRDYLLNQARQDAAAAHIQALGKNVSIVVASEWVAVQSKLATDNPVDKARSSKLPSMIDFGANGCRACDMMEPILATLKTKYEGRMNILFVNVQKNTVLAARYGIKGIPIQVFFDKSGKEIFRHTGFYPMEDIEKKIASMDVAGAEAAAPAPGK